MGSKWWMAAMAACLMAAGVAQAQPASAPAASAPGRGPGMMGGRWGPDFTPGWSMMSPQERQAHQERMRSMHSYEDCRTYHDQHHREMRERAQSQGRTLPEQARRDPCSGLAR
ncbi:hypothetical protein [Caldimonas sp. KR1-144]|uniref:hypothetical protein n=1 Tax=Caldimonas sp. KR1-144 TaxID=3400911 RepID=UPI003C0E3B8E